MPATAWKKYTNFAPKNLPPSVYSGTFLFSGIPVILLISLKENGTISRCPALLRVRSDAASARIFPDEPEDGTDC